MTIVILVTAFITAGTLAACRLAGANR